MSVRIYVEGGGQTSNTQSRCREGFTEYCSKLARQGSFRVVACGSRQDAFERFRLDVATRVESDGCALLVDAEGSVLVGTPATVYLTEHDRWSFAELPANRVFLMVQAMEAWLLSDRAQLAHWYGSRFRTNTLPGDERHIEEIRKDDLVPTLVRASRDTRKEEYHKTRHAFALLAIIRPEQVEAGSAYAAEFHRFLRAL